MVFSSHWGSRTGSASTLFGGGGGGFSTVTCVVPWAVRPRTSVAVAFTVIGPGAAPVVFKVALLPVPLIVPAELVQFDTVTLNAVRACGVAGDRGRAPPLAPLMG